MTSPPEQVKVKCPNCGNIYEDWFRGSLNLGLDDFDDKYIDEATSSTCPECGHKVCHQTLVVGKDGTWQFSKEGLE